MLDAALHYPLSDLDDFTELARRIRHRSLQMVSSAKSSHIGTAFSSVDLLAVLYGEMLSVRPTDPAWSDRDRFILSKGHGCVALYCALAERGFFPLEELDTFYQDGSDLMGHASHKGVLGVELSTGSLGHGLPVATGMALAAHRDGNRHRVVALLSDGECDEGSNWEAILFAGHHRLDNLVAIVDFNKIQSLGRVDEVMELEPLGDKWKAFHWAVREIDGHDFGQIRNALGAVPFEPGKPSCIVAHTVKGKGVSFMEDDLLWHYRSPDADEYERAMTELEAAP
jgi:transketolase